MKITPRISKASEGLGFGDGSISAKAIVKNVSAGVYASTVSAINSAAIIVPIDTVSDGSFVADDGCGDGRATSKVLIEQKVKQRSLHRAKVFGGGAAMTAAMLIGLGKGRDVSVQELFAAAVFRLQAENCDFGAHFADHVSNSQDCGCGAIDRAPAILQAVVTYQTAIAATIAALGFAATKLEVIFKNFEAYAKAVDAQAYSGKKVLEQIQAAGKVTKELTGAHQEAFIVLNTVEDYTVDQQLVRSISNDQIQAFAVDVWRLQRYAKNLFKTETEQQQALLSELVYTLATAAVLTAGDQTVYVVSQD